MINAYEVLGIRNFATQEEIRIAYRTMSKKYHPDLHQGDVYYEEKFKEVQAAYDALSNFERHMALDNYLRQISHEEAERQHHEQQSEAFPRDSSDETDTQTTKLFNGKKRIYTQRKHVKTVAIVFTVLILAGWGIYSFKGSFITTNRIVAHYNMELEPDNSLTLPEGSDHPEGFDPVNDRVKDGGLSFSIDATKDEVRKIQGDPDNIVEVNALNQVIWYYEMSSVTFDNGRVSEYANIGNNLQIAYYKSVKKGTKQSFSIGDTRADVLKAQGNPMTTMRIKPLEQEIWYYGESRVLFVKGKVSEFSNNEQNLLVSYNLSDNLIH